VLVRECASVSVFVCESKDKKKRVEGGEEGGEGEEEKQQLWSCSWKKTLSCDGHVSQMAEQTQGTVVVLFSHKL